MEFVVERKTEVSKSYRSERARGLFNVTEEDGSSFKLEAEIPAEDGDWQIGVVVGTSGSGKTSLGQDLEHEGFKQWTGGRWVKGKPIIDSIADKTHSFDEVTGILSQVGLGSVPAWLRPYHILSNGEQFRAQLAQLLMRTGGKSRVWVDEFTSVLDRTVAQIGSAAFAKTWRKVPGRQIVLMTPHHDVLEWIQPDWVFDTDSSELTRGWLQPEAEDRSRSSGGGVEPLLAFTV